MAGPEVNSGFTRVRFAFYFSAALCAIEFADRVSAYFDNAMLHAISFVLASADGALHHHIRAFGQCPRELRLLAERNNPVPVCSALPIAVGVLPGLFRRN